MKQVQSQLDRIEQIIDTQTDSYFWYSFLALAVHYLNLNNSFRFGSYLMYFIIQNLRQGNILIKN
jgi:hypothetical protein